MPKQTALEELGIYRLLILQPDPAPFVAHGIVVRMIDAAFRAIADKDTEIARLQAELDSLRGATPGT
jgi:hypothetical protein